MRRAVVLGGASLLLGAPGAARADADLDVDLSALGRASSRPEECGGTARAHASRWDRARTPGLMAYCDALSRGYAALRSSPEAAKAQAVLAEHALGGRAAPLVLMARAAVRLGKDADALETFARALRLSPKSLDAPGALHDYAVAQVRTGKFAEAAASYRILVPRAELLGDTRDEVAVLVEAGVLVMSAGKDALPEAVGYLTEARRRSPPLLRPAVLAALALALDRSGREAEAAAAATEAGGTAWLDADGKRAASGAPDALALPPGEREAMLGMVLLGTDRDRALALFKESLALGAEWSSPFLERTRKHLDAASHGRA
ncbi:MAG TPA: hypothetical protein VHE30_07455 [Polyangiaceae bacterium]|nr:hypothetical protein [Polyangiaceae bacterium]